MRVLIKLRSEKNSSYDIKYYHKLQGFVYNLLKNSPFENLHDMTNYKFFCFSNIFPIGDLKEGDLRNLVVSSPDRSFIVYLFQRIEELRDNPLKFNIGDLFFSVHEISVFSPKIKYPLKLATGTPITLRIPEYAYEKYGIPKENRKKNYLYWRPEYPFEAFIKQLEENLIKKYNDFYKDRKFEDSFPIFEQFNFKKSTVNHIVIDGKEYQIPGSIWNFDFSYLNKKQWEILKFGIDCGFGERNSFGFGFVNPIK